MIVIDPRYTDTAAGREDEWIPIRPGTDAALVADCVGTDRRKPGRSAVPGYCVGYDEKRCRKARPPTVTTKPIFSARAMTAPPKRRSGPRVSPVFPPTASSSWPVKSAQRNRYICQGWGPQRQANGELTSRAIAMLPILTGNVGINGGNSGARESTYTITIERMPLPENPVKRRSPALAGPTPSRPGNDRAARRRSRQR
jgi:Tat-targeted selenate reductase subunit YnfE